MPRFTAMIVTADCVRRRLRAFHRAARGPRPRTRPPRARVVVGAAAAPRAHLAVVEVARVLRNSAADHDAPAGVDTAQRVVERLAARVVVDEVDPVGRERIELRADLVGALVVDRAVQPKRLGQPAAPSESRDEVAGRIICVSRASHYSATRERP